MFKRITFFTFLMFSIFITPTYAFKFDSTLEEINEYKILNNNKEERKNIEFFDDALYKDVVLGEVVQKTTYTVKKGDNLYRIALNHDITLEELFEWNDLNDDLIYPGDVLIVSKNQNETENKTVKTNTTVYTNKSNKTKKVDNNSNNQSTKITTDSNIPDEIVGREMTVTATAYTAYCEGCSGTTAYGIDLRSNPNQKVIAVDPKIIPLGTKVWVEGYGVAIAGDTGGAIKGNKIDVFIPSHNEAMEWGVKKIKIKILE